MVNLDDASPNTAPERARHYHYGDGSNRWNDKSLQFPVCSNGISGVIGDHSMMDAGTVFGLNAFVTKAILEYPQEDQSSMTNGKTPIELNELILVTDEVTDRQIDRIKMDFARNTTGVEHDFFTMQDFGDASFRSVKCPPKSAFQVIVMLASKKHFGSLEPCWETASLSNFYKGRVEISQGLLPPVAEYIAAHNDDSLPTETRQKLFQEACKAHASSITRAVRGRGTDRYLTSLRQVAMKEEGSIALFDDPIYSKTRPRKLMAHCHETGMMEQAFLLRDPDAMWLHYTVEDNWYVIHLLLRKLYILTIHTVLDGLWLDLLAERRSFMRLWKRQQVRLRHSSLWTKSCFEVQYFWATICEPFNLTFR